LLIDVCFSRFGSNPNSHRGDDLNSCEILQSDVVSERMDRIDERDYVAF
jgi:hypothetical protein